MPRKKRIFTGNHTFFSRCGDNVRFSITELKLCNDGELPFFSGLDSLSGVIRGDDTWLYFVGDDSLLVDFDVMLKPSVLLMGDIVRSGDNVI